MLRTVGLALILISGAGLGFCKSCELTQREKALGNLLRLVILLKGEIRCGNACLPDAFGEISGKLPEEYSMFLQETAGRMRECPGIRLGEIFRQCAEGHLKKTALSPKEREAFSSLGEHLGYLDLEMQIQQLTLYEGELIRSMEELRSEMPAKKKVYQSLGVLGGMLLAILVW